MRENAYCKTKTQNYKPKVGHTQNNLKALNALKVKNDCKKKKKRR